MATIKVRGVGRMADNTKAVLVMLDDEPTNEELVSLHDWLSRWRPCAHIAAPVREAFDPPRTMREGRVPDRDERQHDE